MLQVMIVMELMGLGDLSKYLWENYRYEVINYAMTTHTHTHTHTHSHTYTYLYFRVVSLKFGISCEEKNDIF